MTANEILSPACGRNCLLTILLSGDIYACRRMESVAGNANTDDIYQVRNGAAMNFYRQYDKFEKCGKCELKGGAGDVRPYLTVTRATRTPPIRNAGR